MANIDIKIAIMVTFPIGAIAGYFTRLFIEDKVIRRRDRDKRYAEAYESFSKSFTPALYLLDDPNQITYHIIADEFPKHKAAMLDFEHMLRGTKSENKFREKWDEYKNKCKRIKKYSLGDAPNNEFSDLFESDNVTVRDFNKELKQLINELLAIAKH